MELRGPGVHKTLLGRFAMPGQSTNVHKYNRKERFAEQFRSGVSLHSHTMHSKEHLGRLPGYISKVPVASYIIEREIGRMHLYSGRTVDFRKFYWTPPLSAREAFDLERRQIEKHLGLRALVSLTDHDNIDAGLHLRMVRRTAQVPVSVEWSVPFQETVFHFGVHNLPDSSAKQWMAEFARYTAKPGLKPLRELFHDLNAEPGVLIVLNHPYWDAESVGPEQHKSALAEFLETLGPLVHALELNGMRSRRENREVIKLAELARIPVVSGGDRHGCEPNAVLNLTSAVTFEEFVAEIREEQRSDVVLMPQFFEPLQLRLLEGAWHALCDAPGEFGRRHWMTRVFIEGRQGEIHPLSRFTGTRFEQVVDQFRWIMALLASPQLRPALRIAFLGNEEGGI
jgi:hypothetical protein